MSQSAIRSKWKFIVEFEDEETQEISGTIGQAGTREECEELIEFDVQYHIFNGRTVINAEAAEICAECEGEGKLAAGNGGQVICDACGGRIGPIARFKAKTRPRGISRARSAAAGMATLHRLAEAELRISANARPPGRFGAPMEANEAAPRLPSAGRTSFGGGGKVS